MLLIKIFFVIFVRLSSIVTNGAVSNIGGHPIIGEIGGHPIIAHQSGELSKCPWACTCSGLTIDCSQHSLTQVPQKLPSDAERL